MLYSISVLADNIENEEVVHKNKVWKFNFNEKIESKDINKKSLFVKNSEGKIVDICFELKANKRTLLVKSPINGYKPGEQYTLFLSTDIGSNDKNINYLTIDFLIEEEEAKKINTLNNTIDKEIFSVKDYDWLCENIEYDISLQNVLIGEEAWDIIKQSNRFNTAPAKDKEYILAKFNIKLKKTDKDRYVKFDNKMFKIISENNKVYNPNECSIVLNGELDNKLVQGEECSGWIAGYIDKGDSPSIIINKGKESEISFEIKNNAQKGKEEDAEEKKDIEDKAEKEEKEDKKEVLTKEELFEYLDEYKDLLFKDMKDKKELQKLIQNNYSEANKITQKDNVLYDLNNNNMFNNNKTYSNDDLMTMYLYQMLNEKSSEIKNK